MNAVSPYLLFLFVLGLIQVNAQSKYDDLKYTKTASGLQYVISEIGEGDFPKDGDRMWVHYLGLLSNDYIFSSSRDSGPLDFYLGQGQVIKGWDEGLRLIKPGGSMVLKVPAELAYGSSENAPVPPGSVLYFEVALLQVNKGSAIKMFDTKEKPMVYNAKGLQFIEIESGSGSKAVKGDNAFVHYVGYLSDSSIFDSSIKKGDPVRITVGSSQVIKGWDEALLHMREGGKVRANIPAKYAFGKEGLTTLIPPNESIFMDIELVKLLPEIKVEYWSTEGLEMHTSSSGLKYVIVREGAGDLIEPQSIVTIHYTGYLSNKKIFDSSVKRDEPFRIPAGIGALIDGWDEALLLMKKGSKFKLFIPSELAYGKEGAPPKIPKNEDLIFDVEILDVIK